VTRGQRNINWIEQHCRIPEGRFVGQPVKLRPWQREIIRGIYDQPTRRAIISFGRKNANVRRQNKWDRWRSYLMEALAHPG